MKLTSVVTFPPVPSASTSSSSSKRRLSVSSDEQAEGSSVQKASKRDVSHTKATSRMTLRSFTCPVVWPSGFERVGIKVGSSYAEKGGPSARFDKAKSFMDVGVLVDRLLTGDPEKKAIKQGFNKLYKDIELQSLDAFLCHKCFQEMRLVTIVKRRDPAQAVSSLSQSKRGCDKHFKAAKAYSAATSKKQVGVYWEKKKEASGESDEADAEQLKPVKDRKPKEELIPMGNATTLAIIAAMHKSLAVEPSFHKLRLAVAKVEKKSK